MDIQALWELLKEHQELVYGLLLFALSEILGMNPRWQANSVIQFLMGVLKSKVSKAPPVVLLAVALSATGCASLVQTCHEFAQYVDIKAIDCADEEDEKK